MNTFNVIRYNINARKFEPYDVLNALKYMWEDDCKNNRFIVSRDNNLVAFETVENVINDDEYFKFWVHSSLLHQFWSRCEYEVVLKSWPCGDVEEKTDIYEQCKMNLDLIVKLFKENLINAQ